MSYTNQGESVAAPAQPEWLATIQLIAALAFLLATTFSGPLRWMLATAGVSVIAYLPVLGGLAAAIITLCWHFWFGAFGARALLLCGVLCFAIFVGLIFIPSAQQVAFAAYLFIPVYMGLLLAPAWRRVIDWQRGALILWSLVVLAVIVNPYFAYPWVGFEYSVAGVSVETGRQWWAGDVQRHSGVARASFDAAIQAAILMTIVSANTSNRFIRLLIYVATAYCIWLTNSKTVLVVLAAVVVCLEMSAAWINRLRVPFIAGLVALGWAMPLIGVLFQPRLNALNTSASLHSYEDRLRNMWPDAFDLWLDHGTLITGRGLGALGAAQTYFEPQLFNAGDNLHLYLFVSLGLIAAPLIAYVCWQVARVEVGGDRQQRIPLVLFIAALTYGLTANGIENASIALVLGFVARTVCDETEGRKIYAHG